MGNMHNMGCDDSIIADIGLRILLDNNSIIQFDNTKRIGIFEVGPLCPPWWLVHQK